VANTGPLLLVAKITGTQAFAQEAQVLTGVAQRVDLLVNCRLRLVLGFKTLQKNKKRT